MEETSGIQVNETNKIQVISNAIAEYSENALIGETPTLLKYASDDTEKVQIEAYILKRASNLGIKSQINKILKSITNEENEKIREKKIARLCPDMPTKLLDIDDKGNVRPTIENFIQIMMADPYYSDYKYNVLKNMAENHAVTPPKPWTDADEAQSQRYIETGYGLYHKLKHEAALRILFSERQYDPIVILLNSLRSKWDNVPRCEEFLIKWAKAEDTRYVRAVSRIIFDGAVNRAFRPGVQFDNVAVLIGTKQGEGKSTLIRYLAMNDSYFGEIKNLNRDESKNVELLSGVWICELSEVIIDADIKSINSAKAFLSTKTDSYRKPYDKNKTELPRRCIFIGSTNNVNFLTDQTGNRRYFPVEVFSNGRDIVQHEKECRDYITMCYAEAVYRYDNKLSEMVIPESLIEEAERRQKNSTIEDWKATKIQSYVFDLMDKGTQVIIPKLWTEVLRLDIEKLNRKQTQELSTILNKIPCIKKSEKRQRSDAFGRCNTYEKTNDCANCKDYMKCKS